MDQTLSIPLRPTRDAMDGPPLRPYKVRQAGRIYMVCAPDREVVDAIARERSPGDVAVVVENTVKPVSIDEAAIIEALQALGAGRATPEQRARIAADVAIRRARRG